MIALSLFFASGLAFADGTAAPVDTPAASPYEVTAPAGDTPANNYKGRSEMSWVEGMLGLTQKIKTVGDAKALMKKQNYLPAAAHDGRPCVIYRKSEQDADKNKVLGWVALKGEGKDAIGMTATGTVPVSRFARDEAMLCFSK